MRGASSTHSARITAPQTTRTEWSETWVRGDEIGDANGFCVAFPAWLPCMPCVRFTDCQAVPPFCPSFPSAPSPVPGENAKRFEREDASREQQGCLVFALQRGPARRSLLQISKRLPSLPSSQGTPSVCVLVRFHGSRHGYTPGHQVPPSSWWEVLILEQCWLKRFAAAHYTARGL